MTPAAFALALVLGSFLFAATVQARELRVVSSGSGYASISQAAADAGPGDVVVVEGGTRQSPRIIREKVTLSTHGTVTAPITLRAANGQGSVVVESPGSGVLLRITGRHWAVEGMVFDGRRVTDRMVRVDASGVAIRSSVIRNGGYHGIAIGDVSSPAPGVPGFLIEDSHVHDFIHQNSLLTQDAHCIATVQGKDIVVRDNRIHNCSGDAVQLESYRSTNPSMWTRAVIEDNELYTLADEHLGLDANGKTIRPGENAIDIKSGGSATIRRNRMYGFGRCRRGTSYGGTGSGSEGAAVIIHGDVGPVDILDNEIFGANHGLVLGPHQGEPHDVRVMGNLIHSLDDAGYDAPQDGVGLRLSGSNRVVVCNNTVTDIPGRAFYSNGDYQFFNNIFANEGYSSQDMASRISGDFHHNLWYQVAGHPGTGDISDLSPEFVLPMGDVLPCPGCDPYQGSINIGFWDYTLHGDSPALGAGQTGCGPTSILSCSREGQMGALGHCPSAQSEIEIAQAPEDLALDTYRYSPEELAALTRIEPVRFALPDGEARVETVWNADGLYFSLTIDDTEVSPLDQVDILIQPGPERSPRPTTEAFTIRANPYHGVVRHALRAAPGRDFTWQAGISGETALTATGYEVHAFVPWTAIPSDSAPSPQPGMVVGALEIVVRDNDEHRDMVSAMRFAFDRGRALDWPRLTLATSPDSDPAPESHPSDDDPDAPDEGEGNYDPDDDPELSGGCSVVMPGNPLLPIRPLLGHLLLAAFLMVIKWRPLGAFRP